ncbi:MAG: hypothetical protein ACTSSP_06335 [Candidatus Asgardarchaeia archaeon]
MSIKILKLTSGEDIIGEIEYGSKDDIIVENPAKIVLFPAEEHGIGMALMVWLPYSNDKKVSIKNNFIMAKVKPTAEMINEYSSKFGSGIVTPTKEIIA